MSRLLIAFIMISLAMPFVAAANPHESATLTTNGLIVTPIFPDSIRQNANYTFFWYVQNQSNSAFMNNSGISCRLEIYKSSGTNGLHLIDLPGTFDGVEEFSTFVAPGNFTLLGDYIQRIKCNSSIMTGLGGIVDNHFMVTESGRDYSGFSQIPLIISIFGVIIVLLIFAYMLHEEHGVLAAAFAGIAFYMLVPLLNVSNVFLENNIVDANISGMVGTMTSILTWMDYALIIYICVYIMVKTISAYGQEKKEKMEGLR